MSGLPTLSGAKWRGAFQYAVDGVLGTGYRRVQSKGSAFYNADTWTARAFVKSMCEWAGKNPGKTPGRAEIQKWVAEANAYVVAKKEIVIASTPDDLPIGTALALIGGAYHESWHTKYDRRTALSFDEVFNATVSRWSAIKNWGPLSGALLNWSNIVADIRIERLGCVEFPGSPEKMEALQDLILTQEKEGLAEAKKNGIPVQHDLRVVQGAFRDLGLGYTSSLQETAYIDYKKSSPVGWNLVTQGPLKALLDRSIGLKKNQDIDSLWIAMDILICLVQNSQDPEQQEKQNGQGGGEGAAEGEGESNPGQGSGKGKGKGSSKPGDGEGKGGGSGSSNSKEKSSSSDLKEKGQGEDAGGNGLRAGGHKEVTEAQYQGFLEKLLEGIRNGAQSGLSDSNSALSEAISGEVAEDLKNGEKPWRPYDSSLDKVQFARSGDLQAALEILNSVRAETNYVKTRLRVKFLEARRPMTLHGVACGSDLSDRRMIESLFEIRAGQNPTRPDEVKINRPDVSLAVAIVIDQSGSMDNMLSSATQAMVSIADALSALRISVLCVGPRDGAYNREIYYDKDCHRTNGVTIDVFKDWNEPMNVALPRFSSTVAEGGTPLEDGIQYALQALSDRKEQHRLVIVVTDGAPNNPGVCARLIRIGAEHGVSTIGVGIGSDAKCVETLFKIPIVVPKVADLPVILVKTIEAIVFPKRGGKKIHLDGVLGNGTIQKNR